MHALLRSISIFALAFATLADATMAQAPSPARDRLKDLVSIGGVRSIIYELDLELGLLSGVTITLVEASSHTPNTPVDP